VIPRLGAIQQKEFLAEYPASEEKSGRYALSAASGWLNGIVLPRKDTVEKALDAVKRVLTAAQYEELYLVEKATYEYHETHSTFPAKDLAELRMILEKSVNNPGILTRSFDGISKDYIDQPRIQKDRMVIGYCILQRSLDAVSELVQLCQYPDLFKVVEIFGGTVTFIDSKANLRIRWKNGVVDDSFVWILSEARRSVADYNKSIQYEQASSTDRNLQAHKSDDAIERKDVQTYLNVERDKLLARIDGVANPAKKNEVGRSVQIDMNINIDIIPKLNRHLAKVNLLTIGMTALIAWLIPTIHWVLLGFCMAILTALVKEQSMVRQKRNVSRSLRELLAATVPVS
jgi:hypothetical protein